MINVISLGAGVQSTCMAMMAKDGSLPMPDCAIFADTGNEPLHVYTHLENLKKILPFPIHIVKAFFKDSHEDIYEHTMQAIQGKTSRYSGPPAYMKKGFIRRQCTNDFKIQPIRRKLRELIGLKPRQRGGKEVRIRQWIGISTDEFNRMKESRDAYIENVFPLIKLKMSRQDCLDWMKNNGYPLPRKSACIFCPYHDNKTWKDMKENQPEDFALAVQVDEDLRNAESLKYPFDENLYLHRSLKPLKDVNFDAKNKKGEKFQEDMDEECEGMCGV